MTTSSVIFSRQIASYMHMLVYYFTTFKKFSVFILCFIFGCAGSGLPHSLPLVLASGGYSLVEVRGLPTVVASLVAEYGF